MALKDLRDRKETPARKAPKAQPGLKGSKERLVAPEAREAKARLE